MTTPEDRNAEAVADAEATTFLPESPLGDRVAKEELGVEASEEDVVELPLPPFVDDLSLDVEAGRMEML